MALLVLQKASLDGLSEAGFTAATATTGDTFLEDGKQETVLEVDNGSGDSVNVTITAVQTSAVVAGVGPVPIANKVVAVPAGARRIIGPFPKAFVNSTGHVTAVCSAVTEVTVRAVKIEKIDG